MHRKILKPWLFAALAVACVATTAAKACLNYLSDDFKNRGELESMTIEEARDRRILVTELVAEPNEIVIGGKRVRFARAWIEERSLPGHQLVWFPGERKMGGWRFHVAITPLDGLGTGDFKVVTAGRGKRLYETRTSSQGDSVFILPLDRPDVSGLLLRVVRDEEADWDGPFILFTSGR
ncbi:hypothetical protein [Limnoglobus roseus]|uniref:DUF2911 domain-containing protein n=1 Tax=Limnoglobus roseus TaxID=2598579 RepID=A0A5C1A6N4_9BACT|nr:hypothetical protein [Limnoglobus roseus]QEL13913.1 hypothetical protein PX52LOC_00773 [Limnoglobus roseus]